MKNKIGLYFGTFNPIHIGHLALGNYISEYTDIDELWFVVTPHNPHKKKKTLLDDYQRLHMVHIAIENDQKMRASNVEFSLPQPNYTVHTLAYLTEQYPEKQFSLIMGEDNLKSLPKWKNYKVLLENHRIFVYPRISKGAIPDEFINHPSIVKVDAPIMEISSTLIRNSIKEGKSLKHFLHDKVSDYLDEMNFYK